MGKYAVNLAILSAMWYNKKKSCKNAEIQKCLEKTL